jgi:hypothetical protein
MRKQIFAALVLLTFLASTNLFAQSSTLSGTVADPSGALIPGVTINITNVGTGIVTTAITNESGTYNFASVQPGIYKATASLPGFQTQTVTDLQVGAAIQVRQNFTLKVGNVAQSVDVVIASDSVITASSASIGTVLPEQKLRDLPIVGNNVLDLINTMAGVRLDPTFGESGPGVTFAGVSSLQINTVRDGLSVSDGRFNNGVFATTFLTPDLVGEIRVILTPVDAELGRGNGQVQIQTRSGTNRYTGSAVWNVRNTALNANTWANNKNIDAATGQWNPTVPNWQNNHEYTVSYGGPILKNKTFFYALWDQQLNYRRNTVTASVLTPEARNGIFRFFDGWGSNNATANTVSTGTTPSRAVVDFQGNPLTGAITAFPNGTAYTAGQGLKCLSVFGVNKADGSPFTAADCPGGTAITSGTAWDSLRPVTDSTGYIAKVLSKMPAANFFGAPPQGTTIDGLNLAGYQYTQHRRGNGGGGSTTQGQTTDLDRKQFNIKIDHNLNAQHKISGSWSIERDATASDIPNWPDGLPYQTGRRPQVLTVNATSTLSPNLLNEGRFGIRYTKEGVDAPFELSATESAAKDFMLPGSNGYTALVSPGAGSFAFGGTLNGIFNTNPGQYNGNTSSLYSYGDTLSWSHGRHAFRFGGELRMTSTNGYNNVAGGGVVFPPPTVQGGAGNNTSALNTAGVAAPATSLITGGRTNAVNMLYFLAGSVNSVQQLYWIDHQSDVTNGTWQDVTTAPNGRKYRNTIENEWTGFFKDDWKATKNLTLNLGVRYEFYGSPYVKSGLTATAAGLGDGLWGTFGADTAFERWLQPGNVFLTGYGPNGTLSCVMPTCDPSKMTTVEFVGPGTTNPDKKAVPSDRNNFGPAVGFAYQLPWFGEGKTTVRGGYQITYGGSGRVVGGGFSNTTEFIIGNPPGNNSIAAVNNYFADLSGQYLDLRSVAQLVPVKPTNPAVPGGTLNIYGRAALSAYDAHYATPYTENITMSVTRALNRNLTLDLRYVGTLSKKQDGQLPLNTDNIYHNKELFDAIDAARKGQDPALLDQMLAGLNINSTVAGYGPVGTLVGGVLQTGGAALRRNQATNLANGNYIAVADFLGGNGTGFPAGTGAGTLLASPTGFAGVQGRLLRNGCDRLANGQTTVGPNNPTPLRCFSENYIYAVPQLGTAAGAGLQTNTASSNYHSLQSQVTLRPVHGFSYQATYTWSKNLGIPSGTTAFTDPSDRNADYTYTGADRRHDFRSNGTFELPIGPNKLLLSNSNGWVARLVERWQTSIIFNMLSGGRSNVIATCGLGCNTGLYANPVPDFVGTPDQMKQLASGKVEWNGTNNAAGNSHGGTYYGNPSPFIAVPDPQCQSTNVTDTMGFNLFNNGSCTINAVAVRNPDGTAGPIVVQNPLPGTRGNLGQNTVPLAGTWNFDATASKTFTLSESSFLKSMQIRIDATNILNHPVANNPTLNLTSTTSSFGDITTKGNQIRQFQGSLRLTF